MTAFIVGMLLILIIFLSVEWYRIRTLRRIELAERLRLRFSDQRHRLVMHAGSGKMTRAELRGFRYLYDATSFTLKHSALYQHMSFIACTALMDPDIHSMITTQRIRKRDFSPTTVKILRDYVAASNDLVHQFAHPVDTVLAFLSGKPVMKWAFDAGHHAYLKQEREKVMKLRDAGSRALGLASA